MKKLMMLAIILASLFVTSYAFEEGMVSSFEEGMTSSIRDENALANSAKRLFNQVVLTQASDPASGETYAEYQKIPIVCDKLIISTLRFDIIEIRWAYGEHDADFFKEGGGTAVTLADNIYLVVNGNYSVYINSIIGVSVVKTVTVENIVEDTQDPDTDPVIFLLHSNE